MQAAGNALQVPLCTREQPTSCKLDRPTAAHLQAFGSPVGVQRAEGHLGICRLYQLTKCCRFQVVSLPSMWSRLRKDLISCVEKFSCSRLISL